MWHGEWSGADWAWMSALMLLFWTVVIAGVIWIVRGTGRRSDDGVPSDKHEPAARPSAREILDERFARGELSKEEYRAARDLLSTR